MATEAKLSNAVTTAHQKPARRDPVDEACDIHEEAVAAYARGNAKRAERLLRRALGLFERYDGPDTP